MKKFLILAVLSLAFITQVCAQNVLSSNYSTSTNLTNKDDFTPYWKFTMEGMGIGFLKGGEKIWDIFSIGAKRYITEKTTIGARLGYSSIDINNQEYENRSWNKSEAELRFITIPVELGYLLANTEGGFEMMVFAGLGINYCLKAESSGSYTLNGTKYEYENDLDLDGKIGLDGRVGIKMLFYDIIGVSASYQVPLNSKQEKFTGEDAYPKIGLSFGI